MRQFTQYPPAFEVPLASINRRQPVLLLAKMTRSRVQNTNENAWNFEEKSFSSAFFRSARRLLIASGHRISESGSSKAYSSSLVDEG